MHFILLNATVQTVVIAQLRPLNEVPAPLSAHVSPQSSMRTLRDAECRC